MSPGNPGDLEAARKAAEQMREQVVPGLEAALAQAQQMQQQLLVAQQKIAEAEAHGQAGGGLVRVTLNGNGRVTAVQIDPKVVDPDDVETLQDLIVGALADAANEMTELVKGYLGPLADLRQPPMGS
jgi:hypothetical protein